MKLNLLKRIDSFYPLFVIRIRLPPGMPSVILTKSEAIKVKAGVLWHSSSERRLILVFNYLTNQRFNQSTNMMGVPLLFHGLKQVVDKRL